MIQSHQWRRLFKAIGYLVTPLCIGYVSWRLYKMDFSSFKNIPQGRLILVFVASVISYAVVFLMMGWGWRELLQGVSQRSQQPSAKEILFAYTKANLAKYLPGNVLEFFFRNYLVSKYGYSHRHIFLATLLELALSLFVAILFALPAMSIIGTDLAPRFFIEIMVGAFAIFFFVTLYFSRRRELLPELRSNLCIKKSLIASIVFILVFLNLGAILVFTVQSLFLIPLEFKSSCILISTFTFAWLVGTIVPGAPGGFGVKEATAVFLVGERYTTSILLAALVFHRVVSICGDVLAYMMAKAWQSAKQN